ncbi:MAG TPA: hypothetical protein VFC65_12185 [Prolixibacteraceae bacterium]|nr:hypothetical protein [Prolixibacteraceae bacterium]
MSAIAFKIAVSSSFILKAQENSAQFQIPQALIPVEVMVGGKASMYQMSVDKRFAPGSKFKFFNLINYEVDGDEFTPDNFVIQSIGYFEFAKGFDVGAGENLKAFGGFKPVVSVEFTNSSRDRGIIIQPVYEVHKNGEFSTMAMFEWHPVNERKFQPYFRIQAMTS